MIQIEPGQAAAAAVIAVALAWDLRRRIIPNRLTLPACAAGAAYSLAFHGWEGLLHALAGIAGGLLPLLLIYWLHGIGAGDVKLFAALGAWLGAASVLQLLFCSIVAAGAIGIALAIVKRRRLRGLQFPFMAAVAPAAVVLWMQGQGGLAL